MKNSSGDGVFHLKKTNKHTINTIGGKHFYLSSWEDICKEVNKLGKRESKWFRESVQSCRRINEKDKFDGFGCNQENE